MNKAIYRFGCLTEDPVPSVFNKLQLSLIAEINTWLRHLPPKHMILRAPQQERRHCDSKCIA